MEERMRQLELKIESLEKNMIDACPQEKEIVWEFTRQFLENNMYAKESDLAIMREDLRYDFMTLQQKLDDFGLSVVETKIDPQKFVEALMGRPVNCPCGEDAHQKYDFSRDIERMSNIRTEVKKMMGEIEKAHRACTGIQEDIHLRAQQSVTTVTNKTDPFYSSQIIEINNRLNEIERICTTTDLSYLKKLKVEKFMENDKNDQFILKPRNRDLAGEKSIERSSEDDERKENEEKKKFTPVPTGVDIHLQSLTKVNCGDGKCDSCMELGYSVNLIRGLLLTTNKVFRNAYWRFEKEELTLADLEDMSRRHDLTEYRFRKELKAQIGWWNENETKEQKAKRGYKNFQLPPKPKGTYYEGYKSRVFKSDLAKKTIDKLKKEDWEIQEDENSYFLKSIRKNLKRKASLPAQMNQGNFDNVIAEVGGVPSKNDPKKKKVLEKKVGKRDRSRSREKKEKDKNDRARTSSRKKDYKKLEKGD